MNTKEGYVYDILEHGLTQSQIANYLECKRYFYLSLIRGWTPKILSDSIVFGILFHASLEFFYKNLDGPVDVDQIPEVILTDYEEENDAETWSLEQRQEWVSIAAKLKAIFPAY